MPKRYRVHFNSWFSIDGINGCGDEGTVRMTLTLSGNSEGEVLDKARWAWERLAYKTSSELTVAEIDPDLDDE